MLLFLHSGNKTSRIFNLQQNSTGPYGTIFSQAAAISPAIKTDKSSRVESNFPWWSENSQQIA